MNKQSVKNQISAQLPFLQKEYNVKRLGIFGSFAKNKQRQSSDIDIMVEFFKPVSFFEFIDLEHYLSRVLKKEVDLVTKKALKPAIKKDVLKDIIYAEK